MHTSYDVTVLFKPLLVKQAINIIRKKLEQDTELQKRTSMSSDNIIELLGFCLNNTYSLFQGQFYEQIQGVAMGSPVSHIAANLYMEHFEYRVIGTAENPPRICKRCVDVTFVI